MTSRFSCLRLEGGLISADLIDKIASGEADGQKPQDFGISANRAIIDEIAASWNDVCSYWAIFQMRLAQVAEGDSATSLTRDRWMAPFFSILGYELTFTPKAVEVDGQTYAISHHVQKNDDSAPVHVVGCRQYLDCRPESGKSKLAPHSLMQDYLNRTEYLWGIVTNGYTLRILRNSSLMRKQAYIEFDLEQMMRDNKFADFALLFRLIHITKIPRGDDDANNCTLERYHIQTVQQGGRVRDHLRDGVEKSLKTFANGFLNHQRNESLRAKVKDGSLTPFDYYQQLLRLIYRFLFLMVSEERNLITDNRIYRDNYSISRIRRLVETKSAYTKQDDLWIGLKATFRMFQDEYVGTLLEVPILNGDMFDSLRTSEINNSFITNIDLLTAIRFICMYREDEKTPLRRINYSALDVEELGSVYESLLEFHPAFSESNGKIAFEFLVGTERKSTGSYYTPPELVNELIISALVPLINERLLDAKTGDQKAAALIGLTVCDPACGSGHFLLAAARTIGKELAKARTGDEEPSPEQMRIAIRDVITHCIYGVDKNPLAVDLCKFALWLEGHTISKPLTFLDHRIRCGDSLVGVFDLSVLKNGIPDDAFTTVSGNDKAVASELKKQNKNERLNQNLTSFNAEMRTLSESRKPLLEISDDTPAQIRQKVTIFRSMQQEGTPWCKDKTVCDLWTAAFFIRLTRENQQKNLIPTTKVIRSYLSGSEPVDIYQVQYIRQYAKQNRFFHWYLEFPEVFERGGFDCVLGNPPWERIKLQEQEFFATRDINIANARNKSERKRLIDLIQITNKQLAEEFINAKGFAESSSGYIRNSNRFALSAVGDVNTYSLFTELSHYLLNKRGKSGLIIPTGIATDDTTKQLFGYFVNNRLIVSLLGFTNWNNIFPDVGHRFSFCLFTFTGEEIKTPNPQFVFYAHDVTALREQERFFTLSNEDLKLINPNTLGCPLFRTIVDAEITKKIYKKMSVCINDENGINEWGIKLVTMIHMANDSHLFKLKREKNTAPLYEGKMIWIYNHRYSHYTDEMLNSGQVNFKEIQTSDERELGDPSYFIQPRYYIEEKEINNKINGYWNKKWFIVYRTITLSVNERTAIFDLVPLVGCGNSVTVVLSNQSKNELLCCLLAQFNSLPFDYILKQKLGAITFNFFIFKQLPVISPKLFQIKDINFIVPRVLELVYTSWDIKAFADDVWRDADVSIKNILKQQHEANIITTGGHEWKPPEWSEIAVDGIPLPPFKWDEDRRDLLRAELDAWYAMLYGLSRDELRYILDPADIYGLEFPGETFRVLKDKEMKKYGEYRTRRLVLEAWDRIIKSEC